MSVNPSRLDVSQVGFYLIFKLFEVVEADGGFYDFEVSVDDVGGGDALDATKCGE